MKDLDREKVNKYVQIHYGYDLSDESYKVLNDYKKHFNCTDEKILSNFEKILTLFNKK